MRGSQLLLSLALLGTLPASLSAQYAPARAQLDSLRSTLAAASTVAQVDEIRLAWGSRASGEVRKLGDGFALLARNNLLDSAATPYEPWTHFDQLVRNHPSWPYARLGLAMSSLELYRSRSTMPSDYETRAGGSHYDGYVIQLRRLLAIEPGFEPAINWLASTMEDELDREQPKQGIELLSRLVDSAGVQNLDALLVLARDARTRGNHSAALARLDAYARAGGDHAVASLERARTIAATGDLRLAASTYLDGTHGVSPDGRAAYRLDLEWVARPAELAHLDSLPPETVPDYIARFWSLRDAQELREDGERLQEHLRRWVYVHEHFRVPDPQRRNAYARVFISNIRGSTGATACLEDGANSLDDLDYREPARAGHYRSGERVLDHRAIIYMRHGEPYIAVGGVQFNGDRSQGAAQEAASSSQYATWVYFIEGMPRFFNFQPNGALGSNQAGTMVLNEIPNLDAVLRLANFSPEYARLAGLLQFYQISRGSVIPVNCQAPVRQVIREQREGAEAAVRTDTYLRRMATQLPVSVQLYAMGQPGKGSGQLLVAVALSTRELLPSSSDGQLERFAMKIEVAAIDSVSGNVLRRDTTMTFSAPRGQPRDGWMAALMTMPLGPGQREVRVAVLQGTEDRGAVLGGRVYPAASRGLAISDVVLGRESTGLKWEHRGESLVVSPSDTYREGAGLDLFYEVFGLEPGQTYRTELSLTQVTQAKASATLSFSDKATASEMGFSRRLVLQDLKPATYQVKIVIVEEGSGRRTERTRSIVVGKP